MLAPNFFSNRCIDRCTKRELKIKFDGAGVREYLNTSKPGITFRKLADGLNLGIGDLQYHLYKRRYIFKKNGGRRYLFPRDMEGEYQRLSIAISTETRRKIMLLLTSGEKSQSELAESLGLTQATVNHHIKELLKLGVVKSRKEGRKIIYELNCDVDTLQEYRPKIWEKWAEQLVELKGLESTAGIYILDCI